MRERGEKGMGERVCGRLESLRVPVLCGVACRVGFRWTCEEGDEGRKKGEGGKGREREWNETLHFLCLHALFTSLSVAAL